MCSAGNAAVYNIIIIMMRTTHRVPYLRINYIMSADDEIDYHR